MERMISSLVSGYENGLLTRRELIKGLGALTTAQIPPASSVVNVASINHVLVAVSDLERSVDFYTRVFGLTDLGAFKAQLDGQPIRRLSMGGAHVSLRGGSPASPVGVIDHFALGVTGFDEKALTAEFKRRGAEPRNDPQFAFHVKDPDGVAVQIIQHANAPR